MVVVEASLCSSVVGVEFDDQKLTFVGEDELKLVVCFRRRRPMMPESSRGVTTEHYAEVEATLCSFVLFSLSYR